MISTVTTTTVTTVTSVALATSLALFAVLALLAVLILKEVLTASNSPRGLALTKVLNVALVSLLVSFAFTVFVKVAEVLN